MASLVEHLTASGGTESAGFLNDIIAHLWPNINVAGCRMVKQIVEPILASTLPGPLSSLKFVKLDLGPIPMRVSDVDVHKTSNGGIKLDMDVTWESKSDIELDGSMVPKIGIEHVHLKGRLSVLLAPITDVIPLIGAAQVSFINPPELKLDFTNAADIADSSIISGTIRKTILGIISGMAVLPNRYLVKLSTDTDYFATHQPALGVLRLTIHKALGISGPKKSGVKRLLAKVVKDVPDCYIKTTLGADPEWRTSTKDNDHDPEWEETHDFIVSDLEQIVTLDVQDDDLAGDDDIGLAEISVKNLLLEPGNHELTLVHKEQPTNSRVVVSAKFFQLSSDATTVSAAHSNGPDQICGIATILVASASGLRGDRDSLKPNIKISCGTKEFRTAIKSYTPGSDIFNPNFDQVFSVPLTADVLQSTPKFRIALLNGETEAGAKEVGFNDVLGAEELRVAEAFEFGDGVSVRVSISISGLHATDLGQLARR